MNIKKRISEIVLLTLAVVVGGGYVYYSLLTNSNDKFSKNPLVVYSNTPVVGSNTRIGTISTKNPHKSAPRQQNAITPGVSGTQLPSVTGISAVGSYASSMFSGNTGYSYSYNAKTRDKINPSTSGTGIGGMLAYGSSGRGTGGEEQAVSGGGGGVITAPGASTPFAVPLQPGTPPGGGIILVDPMTDPVATDRIPVGEGGWILLLLALGYVAWKAPSISPLRGRVGE